MCKDDEPTNGIACTLKECAKDTGAYSYQFAQDYNISSFQYLACSGSNVSTVLDTQVNVLEFGKPDLVTINAGGDDGKTFAKVVLPCVYMYNSNDCDKALDDGNATIAGISTGLDDLFDGIKQTADPSATVVVMSYPQLWGNLNTTDCGWPFDNPTPGQKQRMDQLVLDMNAALSLAAGKANFLFADVNPAYAGHRICDKTGIESYSSWFQWLPKCGNDAEDEFYCELSVFHPVLDGQSAYLSTLKSALGC